MVNERLLQKQKKKLRSIVQRFTGDLDDIIDSEQKKVGRSRTKEALLALFAVNMFMRDDNLEAVSNMLEHVTTAYHGGIDYAPGKNSVEIMSHNDIIEQGVKEFITKMGDDVKDKATSIIQEGSSNGQSIADISQTLQDQLEIDRTRANAIARTEVMRSNNAGSYLQAKQEDYQFFVIDMRDEVCDFCADEYEGKVFTMDETEMLPPLHPNCACIPEFFMTEAEANGWAEEISSNVDSTDEESNGAGAWVDTERVQVEVTNDEEEG